MRPVRAILIAGALALGAQATQAADILPPPPPVVAPASMPAAEFSGWYLRGDAGIGQNTRETFRTTFAATSVLPGLQYETASVSKSFMLGAGVGYQFNSWFRADATAEYRGGTRWRQVESHTDATCGPAGRCVDLFRSNISSSVFLANGYVDLGTWYNVVPYLGAGIGVAHNRVNGISSVEVNSGSFGIGTSIAKTNFAWALMAGLAINLSPNMKIDLGYRYLNQGSMSCRSIICSEANPCLCRPHRMDLASHDVRVGLRYMFGETVYAAPFPAPAPLIRKY